MSDKERLEEIKEWFDNDGEMHEFQIEWLIEQAEKVEGMTKEIEKCYRDIEELMEEKRDLEKLAFDFGETKYGI